MNVLSLFDGISCGQIALNRCGIEYDNYYSSEIDKHCISVTQSNYPDTIQVGDITQIYGCMFKEVDLLIGGSSCQGFSFAGKQMNFNDNRSKLFFEYVRILNELKPKYFLLENVIMKTKYQDIISGYLGVQPIKINSNLVSCQNRNRLYWTNIQDVKEPNDMGITFDDIYIESNQWIDDSIINKIKLWNAYQKPIDNAILIGSKSKLPCLTARGYNQYHSGMILITDGKRYRYLNNEEAELAQTLPIGYTSIERNNREKSRMIGNGWTVDIISHILSYMRN